MSSLRHAVPGAFAGAVLLAVVLPFACTPLKLAEVELDASTNDAAVDVDDRNVERDASVDATVDANTSGEIDATADASAGTKVRVLSQGFKHECLISFEGTLRCFGVGLHGVLGVGTLSDSATLVAPQVAGPVLDHASGDYRSCAILTNGAVQCWGENRQGVLGIGVLGGDRETPQNITLPFGALRISVGTDHTLVVLQNGDVMGWGLNFEYQLADATRAAHTTPFKVPGITKKAKAVAAGFQTSCVVLEDGQLQCWGLTSYLPFDSAVVGDHVMMPTAVVGLPDKAAAVEIGIGFGCARLEGGDVYCWGDNASGQLGDGTTTDRIAPVRVKGLNDAAIELAVGGQSACALLATGDVRCWGSNTSAQLGDPTKVPHSTPITVAAAKNATAITIGSGFGCAGFMDGTMKCWGSPPLGVTGF